jgi:hypothetical protein
MSEPEKELRRLVQEVNEFPEDCIHPDERSLHKIWTVAIRLMQEKSALESRLKEIEEICVSARDGIENDDWYDGRRSLAEEILTLNKRGKP